MMERTGTLLYGDLKGGEIMIRVLSRIPFSHILLLTVISMFLVASDVKAERPAFASAASLSAPADSGFENDVYAMTNYGGDLIVGGAFFKDGDGNVAGRVAGWNGTNWYPLPGLPGGPEVYALHAFNAKLYAGTFATSLYEWNGANWSAAGPALGAGIYGSIFTLETFAGDLIAGGSFRFDPVQPSYVAKWNGATWDSLGNGVVGTVRDLIGYDSQLIVGGFFSVASGSAGERIASWDGASWSSLGTGITGGANPGVYALAVYNNELIAAGLFSSAGGTNVNNIARWNGANWQALGTGLAGGACFALTIHNGNLIAGGGFLTAGGLTANYVASWNGSGWSALGADMDSWVRALGEFDTSLVAGGIFTTAGEGYLAKWSGSSWQPLNGVTTSVFNGTDDLIPRGFTVIQNYPNPFNPATTIEYALSTPSLVSISIFNTLGQKVKVLQPGSQSPGTYTAQWDGTNYVGQQAPTGVYLYRVKAGEVTITKKMLLLK
jgi:hypothetical protein